MLRSKPALGFSGEVDETVPGAAHYVQEDAPQFLLDRIEAFVKENA